MNEYMRARVPGIVNEIELLQTVLLGKRLCVRARVWRIIIMQPK